MNTNRVSAKAIETRDHLGRKLLVLFIGIGLLSLVAQVLVQRIS